MFRKATFVITIFFILVFFAGIAAANVGIQPERRLPVDKADYYSAVEAYQLGTVSEQQVSILKSAGYFNEPPAVDHSGGPDPYGYMFMDSSEPNGPAYSWVDITNNGTMWVTPPDDGNLGPINLPFIFQFYGNEYLQFYIQTNGAITFNDVILGYLANQIPTTSYSALIAPMWVDLDPSEGGEIWYGDALVDNELVMVISWINVRPFGNIDGTITVQAVIFSSGKIEFNYGSSSALELFHNESVGIQGSNDGVTGVGISYLDDPVYPYPGTQNTIKITTAVMDGYVFDSDTYEPIINAEVNIDGNQQYFTDADGHYEIGIEPAIHEVVVRKDGYIEEAQIYTVYPGFNSRSWFLIPVRPPVTSSYFTDFEDGPGDFTTHLDFDNEWMHGWTTNEPDTAYSGVHCWDVMLNGDYSDDQQDWLITTQRFQIPENTPYQCSFYHWYHTESLYDGYKVIGSTELPYTEFVLYPNGGYPGSIPALGDCFTGMHRSWEEVVFDLSDYAGESIYILIVFASDGAGSNYPGVAIDDFYVGPAPANVNFWINPVGTTMVPPGGGTLHFDVYLLNNTANMWSNVLYWTEVMLPNGNMYGPVVDMSFGIWPNMNAESLGQTQVIPPGAPAGSYTFYANVGRRPGPHVSSAFTFVKQASAAELEGGSTEWTGSIPSFMPVSDDVTGVTSELPTEYEMAPVYPNPFNPTANVSIALPEAAELTVMVFNVMGQQVAELANGTFSAGVQTFTIDGSALASGIYFVKATVPGQLDAIQKVTLMK